VLRGRAGLGEGAVESDKVRAFAVRASAAERAVDLCVLSTGLVLGAIGAFVLFEATLTADDADHVVAAVGVYAAALPAMFLCALLYAAAFETPRRELFRRLDHAAIFALIAATATPFAVAQGDGGRGCGVAILIWAVAALGIFVKLRFPIGRAYRSAFVFGVSGWTAMIAFSPTVAPRRALLLLLLGGVLYTIGIGFHLSQRLPFRRAIWHGFVIAGALAHYFAIVAIVL
jgi:hemolysin III